MENKNETQNNPYLNAKAEWLERYGDYISQKRNWQVVAFISLIIAFVSVLFVGYMGTQNKLIPYIIEVDKLGNKSNVGLVQNATNIKNPNVIKFSLNEFIFSWRTIWGNAETQRKFILDAYSYVLPQTNQFIHLNEFYQKENPFERAQKENVRVKVTSIVPQNVDTWQVEWEETITTTTGEFKTKDIYRGFFSIEQILPTTEEQILKNPLGIFINNSNYSKILQ